MFPVSATLESNNSGKAGDFRVPWTGGELSHDDPDHEAYLSKFKNSIFHKIKALITKNLEDEPELKSRKKIVEVSAKYFFILFNVHYLELLIEPNLRD